MALSLSNDTSFEAARESIIRYLVRDLNISDKTVRQAPPSWSAMERLATERGGNISQFFEKFGPGQVAYRCPTDPPINRSSPSCVVQLLGRAAMLPPSSSIVLASWITSSEPLDARRFVAYYFLLGASSAIVFDNLCNVTDRAADLDAALAPYEARLQHYREFRCQPWSGKLQMHAMAHAIGSHRSWARTKGFQISDSALVLKFDVDEYLAVHPPGATLHDVRNELLHERICALFIKWRTFGTSGHRCRPEPGVLASYLRRARTEDEVPGCRGHPPNATCAARLEAARKDTYAHGLAPLYDWRQAANSGKYIYIDGTAGGLGLHSCNECAGQFHWTWRYCGNVRSMPNHDECFAMVLDRDGKPRRNASVGLPKPARVQLQLNHYSFQSAHQWEIKKMVPFCTGPNRAADCNVAIMRRGAVPTRYEEIEDRAAIELAARLIEARGGSLASCVRPLLGI